MFVLQTLVLYECEKHPREEDWEEVGHSSLVMRMAMVMVEVLVTLVLVLVVVDSGICCW